MDIGLTPFSFIIPQLCKHFNNFAGSNPSTASKMPEMHLQNFVSSHPNHAEGVYIIRNLLRYIIKPQVDARFPRDEIQPKGLMIYAALRASMIYQACGLDKKEAESKA